MGACSGLTAPACQGKQPRLPRFAALSPNQVPYICSQVLSQAAHAKCTYARHLPVQQMLYLMLCDVGFSSQFCCKIPSTSVL